MSPVIAKPVSIVVLAKFAEVFEKFIESANKYEQNVPKILVADGKETADLIRNPNADNNSVLSMNWTVIDGPSKFSMAGNGNLGLKAVPETDDILYCGDDVRFIQEKTIEKLQEIAYSKPNIGLISPKIIGRGSPIQLNPPAKLASVPPLQMWFPCIYIKRELINKIGYLDEQFNDFGCDDFDYCIRALLEGFLLAVTSEVSVEHEASPEGGPTTFVKNLGIREWTRQQREAQVKLRAKYKCTPAVFNDFLRTGNVEFLKNNGKNIPIPASVGPDTPSTEAAAFLRSRHIYIATPAYGGIFHSNYVTSLVALIDMCKNYEIPYTTSFLFNESLVTRARNRLAASFMENDAYTDCFWIDADIGFNPQDVINLLMHPQEIIAVPCARKNLRLDRVYAAGEKHEKERAEGKSNGKAPSISDLRKICGEFVINFPPDSVPSRIDLGQLIEVQDGGTGFMRIKRSAYEKFRDAYPDRWYLPMAGEEGEPSERKPMFMYFQSGLDEDSKKFNPGGYADYISEDYSFCRLARKAGIKVYVAPWIKATHSGYYQFESDLCAVKDSGGNLR